MSNRMGRENLHKGVDQHKVSQRRLEKKIHIGRMKEKALQKIKPILKVNQTPAKQPCKNCKSNPRRHGSAYCGKCTF